MKTEQRLREITEEILANKERLENTSLALNDLYTEELQLVRDARLPLDEQIGERHLLAAIIKQAVSDLSFHVPAQLKTESARADWSKTLNNLKTAMTFIFYSAVFPQMASLLDLNIEATRKKAVSILRTRREGDENKQGQQARKLIDKALKGKRWV